MPDPILLADQGHKDRPIQSFVNALVQQTEYKGLLQDDSGTSLKLQQPRFGLLDARPALYALLAGLDVRVLHVESFHPGKTGLALDAETGHPELLIGR